MDGQVSFAMPAHVVVNPLYHSFYMENLSSAPRSYARRFIHRQLPSVDRYIHCRYCCHHNLIDSQLTPTHPERYLWRSVTQWSTINDACTDSVNYPLLILSTRSTVFTTTITFARQKIERHFYSFLNTPDSLLSQLSYTRRFRWLH